MPTYLCHGFRWHRDAISFFVIVQDIDDAAPGWVVAPQSSDALLMQFYELFDFLPYRDSRQEEHRDHHTMPQGPGSSGGSRGQQKGQQKDGPATSGDDRTHTIIGGPSKRGKSPIRRGLETQAKQHDDDDDDDDDESPTLSPTHFRPPRGPPAAAPAEEEEAPAPPTSDWSAVTLLEEFDPANLSIVSGPWAYVADHVVRVDTSVSVAEEMLRYEALERSRAHKAIGGRSSSDEARRRRDVDVDVGVASGAVDREGATAGTGWLEKLRDKLQSSELIRWYVVVCGDEERDAHGRLSQQEEEEEGEGETQEEEDYTPRLEEDEDRTIGATSEGVHHEKQQQQQQPPPSEAAMAEKGGKPGGGIGDRGSDDGDFEFRLPEFLDSKAQERPRTAKADWNAVLEKPPPFLKQDPPPIMTSSSVAGTAAAAADDTHDHKTAITSSADASGGVRQRQKKTSSRTSGLRRFFAKRLGVGRKRNSEPTQVVT